MTSLQYVTLTGDFLDGSGNPANGSVTFTASETAYSSGVPAVSGDSPVVAEIVNGQLLALGGGALRLLATDNSLTVDGPTGWWAWSAAPVVNGVAEAPWSFFLPSAPSSRDLWGLRGTGLPSTVTPDGGTASNPAFPGTSNVEGGSAASVARPVAIWDGGRA